MSFVKRLYQESRPIFWAVTFLVICLPILAVALGLTVKDDYARTVISDVISPIYNLAGAAALIFAAVHTRKISKRLAWGWGILGFGQLSFTLGDIIWAIFELGIKTSPSPSIADVGYLLFYPLFFLGIVTFPTKRISRVEWVKKILEISIVMTSVILGYWIFLINPILQ